MKIKKHVVCLFDETGLAGKPWANSGDYIIYCYDIAHKKVRREGNTIFVPWDANDLVATSKMVIRHRGKSKILLGFPPCTDLAVSGAAWFESKRNKNEYFQKEAMQLFLAPVSIALDIGVPYVIENPVSVASTMYRKPDHIFQPYEYGGYLPENDIHPEYPKYIAPRDAYPKKTCYWTGNGFNMPTRKPVKPEDGNSRQHRLLGGKSEKTKRIRSASPRGVAKAIYEANK
jgi:hypothetical protein